LIKEVEYKKLNADRKKQEVEAEKKIVDDDKADIQDQLNKADE